MTMGLLIIMACFHIYWAMGGRVGVDKVISVKDGKAMIRPRNGLIFILGIGLSGCAYVAYTLYVETITVYAGWRLAVLFLLRGIGEFQMMGLFKQIRDTPFTEYDTQYYTPLCLYLAGSLMVLAF